MAELACGELFLVRFLCNVSLCFSRELKAECGNIEMINWAYAISFRL